MGSMQLVSDFAEHELVSLITKILAPFQNSNVIGPGDDAAVTPTLLTPVLTADLLIEDIHFKTNWSSAWDIGVRAAAANLADLLAMGATPKYLTLSLGLPSHTKVEFLDGLVTAIATESNKVSAQVVGGDISRSDKLIVSISAVGDCANRTALLRSAAKPGEIISVIGCLGLAPAGLALFEADNRNYPSLLKAHQQPTVFYAQMIAAWESISAATDISDGLLVDLERMAKASKVMMALDSFQLVKFISTQMQEAGLELGIDPMSWVLAGGDDHGFLVTSKEAIPGAVQIGKVVPGLGVTVDSVEQESLGYQHFRQ